MKFDRSNKFDFCYYGQVNTFGGTIYFAGDGTYTCIYIYKLIDQVNYAMATVFQTSSRN